MYTIPRKFSLFCGINNSSTTFFFRLGYAVWVLKGANLLKPLSYYGKMMDGLTDDTETLRGAYGPRIRRWVGPDALQEAINKNQNIDDEEDYVKPAGIDQLEAVYKDIFSGMSESVMQIFDPALDFAETNYVPDLHRVSFLVNSNGQKHSLDMIMDYLAVDETGHLHSDIFVFELIKAIYCSFLHLNCGETSINIGRKISSCVGSRVAIDYSEICDKEYKLVSTEPEEFWHEFDMFLDFEKHMRMQINDKSFINSEVSIVELVELLRNKYLNQFKNMILADMGNAMLVCAILKYSDNINKYQEEIGEIFNNIGLGVFMVEILNYAKSLNITEVEVFNQTNTLACVR